MADKDKNDPSDGAFYKLLALTVIAVAAILWDVVFSRQMMPGVILIVAVIVLCFGFAVSRRRRR